MIVTRADAGATFSLKVGETLVLELPEMPSSGYRWSFDRLDETRVVVVHSAYRGKDDRAGAGGVATWTLRASAPGKALVKLKRWRQWEGDRSIVERFSAHLDIGPA